MSDRIHRAWSVHRCICCILAVLFLAHVHVAVGQTQQQINMVQVYGAYTTLELGMEMIANKYPTLTARANAAKAGIQQSFTKTLTYIDRTISTSLPDGERKWPELKRNMRRQSMEQLTVPPDIESATETIRKVEQAAEGEFPPALRTAIANLQSFAHPIKCGCEQCKGKAQLPSHAEEELRLNGIYKMGKGVKDNAALVNAGIPQTGVDMDKQHEQERDSSLADLAKCKKEALDQLSTLTTLDGNTYRNIEWMQNERDLKEYFTIRHSAGIAKLPYSQISTNDLKRIQDASIVLYMVNNKDEIFHRIDKEYERRISTPKFSSLAAPVLLDQKLLADAERGDATAQLRLGCAYSLGELFKKDISEAVKWYRKSAEQGNAEAQFMLGASYLAGEGVEQNTAEGLKWLRKSADQGNSNAQFSLGMIYYNGKGVATNYVESIKWLHKAAEQGNASAQSGLGFAYSEGKGVLRNFQTAYGWYLVAVAGGDQQMAPVLLTFEKNLSPSERQAARLWAKQWKPKHSQ